MKFAHSAKDSMEDHGRKILGGGFFLIGALMFVSAGWALMAGDALYRGAGKGVFLGLVLMGLGGVAFFDLFNDHGAWHDK